MSERTSYAAGTPCWVELGTPDLDAAIDFYSGLFGWEVPTPPPEVDEQTGGYRRAQKDGRDVAGMASLMAEGQPPAWSTYVSVDDAAATTAAVRDAGGQVMVEPMPVMDLGKMAVYVDPTGAVVGVWEPGTFIGAGLVNEVGTPNWNELYTRDIAGAKSFYSAVFGWSYEDLDYGETGKYVSIKLDGATGIAGILDLVERGVPEQVPAHWQTYFAVEDCDATVAAAQEAGANLMMGPMDVPVGRFAIITDPQGANFAVIALTEEAREQAP
jgi:predicted enzyme related to lactoylglutathione lyase